MSLLQFSSQCPFTQNTPFFVTGVPGIFLVLVLAFFLDMHIHGTKDVVTISHTARQPFLLFLFAEFFIIQVLFVSMCVVSGGLIAMYIVAFALLFLIFICNPSPDDKSIVGWTKRKIHQTSAFIFFTYALTVTIITIVVEVGAFDPAITTTSLTVKRLAVVLMILDILAYTGMMYIMYVLNRGLEEPWTQPVSYMERLFCLIFFIVILLIPQGQLV